MSAVYTCNDIRRLITKGDLKNPLLREHLAQCQDCLAFGRKYLKEKKEAEATGVEMKSDPQTMAARLLAMNEEKQSKRKRMPRWVGVVIGLLVAALFLLIVI